MYPYRRRSRQTSVLALSCSAAAETIYNFSCFCPRTKKVKASVLNRILERVTSEEELKYARLGLKIFKTQGIGLEKKTATLFVKVTTMLHVSP